MSLVMLVFSVSPILAPLVGSGLIVPFGWRAVFVAVTIASILSFLLVAFVLPETRAARRAGGGQCSQCAGWLRRTVPRLALPRTDLHRRFRYGEFLRFPRQFVLHLYRPLRPDADANTA